MRNKRYDFIHLPQEFHEQHEFCEFLLYQIEDFITSDIYKEFRVKTVQFDEQSEIIDFGHILDYLLKNDKYDKYDELITSAILNSVIADTCQFLQIALFSSLQKRLTVTFSLIRKPFVYNLIIILRLYFESDFLERFNKEDDFDTTGLSKEDIIKLLTSSETLLISKSIKALNIYDFVFNKSLQDSLINISNKALHPSTTINKNNKTGIQNINFVFSDKEAIMSQWEYLYKRLRLLLLYLNEVLEIIVFDLSKLDNKIYLDRLTERANFFKQNNA